jgi:hypothetical protein
VLPASPLARGPRSPRRHRYAAAADSAASFARPPGGLHRNSSTTRTRGGDSRSSLSPFPLRQAGSRARRVGPFRVRARARHHVNPHHPCSTLVPCSTLARAPRQAPTHARPRQLTVGCSTSGGLRDPFERAARRPNTARPAGTAPAVHTTSSDDRVEPIVLNEPRASPHVVEGAQLLRSYFATAPATLRQHRAPPLPERPRRTGCAENEHVDARRMSSREPRDAPHVVEGAQLLRSYFATAPATLRQHRAPPLPEQYDHVEPIVLRTNTSTLAACRRGSLAPRRMSSRGRSYCAGTLRQHRAPATLRQHRAPPLPEQCDHVEPVVLSTSMLAPRRMSSRERSYCAATSCCAATLRQHRAPPLLDLPRRRVLGLRRERVEHLGHGRDRHVLAQAHRGLARGLARSLARGLGHCLALAAQASPRYQQEVLLARGRDSMLPTAFILGAAGLAPHSALAVADAKSAALGEHFRGRRCLAAAGAQSVALEERFRGRRCLYSYFSSSILAVVRRVCQR